MKSLIIVTALAVGFHICASDENSERTENQLLNRLLLKTDARVRPNSGGDPVDVLISFHVISFGSINEVDMEYTMDVYLRQQWQDSRMEFTERDGHVTVPPKSVDRMWMPDIFFPNEKRAALHDITVPNKLMRIYPNGTIIHSVRITMTLSCPMELSHFPLDSQQCFFKVESYGHETSDLRLHWHPEGAVDLAEDMRLPQFDLVSIDEIDCTRKYSMGDFPCLSVRFSLKRQFGFYLLQTYIPSVLIVILSWVSFWINVEAVPARISLGVTTVLTMATQLTGSRTNIPKVSYPKAMDIWMAMCMIFVFAGLLEYAFVNVLSRTSSDDKSKKTDAVQPDDEQEQMVKTTNGQGGEGKLRTLVYKPNMRRRGKKLAELIDYISRYMFPGTFLVFNIFYWSIYLQSNIVI